MYIVRYRGELSGVFSGGLGLHVGTPTLGDHCTGTARYEGFLSETAEVPVGRFFIEEPE